MHGRHLKCFSFPKLIPPQISPQVVSALEHSCLTMHLCLQIANGALVGGGVGGEGVVWTGPAGVVLLRCITSVEPSCAVLFSPWVKWCQPSRLMCPPALIRVGSELEYRSMNGLITCRRRGSEAIWNGQNMKQQHQRLSSGTVLPWQHSCCVVRNLGV